MYIHDMELTDDDIMPYGIYEGMKLKDIWASYFLRILRDGITTNQLKKYIEDRKEIFIKQVKEEQYLYQRTIHNLKKK